MFNFLTKTNFYFQKPKVIIVVGDGRFCAGEAIFQVLKEYLKVKKITEGEMLPILNKNEILIFQTKLPSIFNFKELEFLIKNSSLPILIITHLTDIPPNQDFFIAPEEKVREILKIAKEMPPFGYLVLNYDDETVRSINDVTNLNTLTFGFGQLADFQASNIKINGGTNLKLNYKGNMVPVWLNYLFGKEQIYSVLAGFAVGAILNLNLIKIIESSKNYKSLPGKMRLIEGIKKTFILDDSESATVFSMMEALEILRKIELPAESKITRKIAVLGDIIGIGKYAIEAHEAIGEKILKNANLLFTVGPKAKFIAQAAQIYGLEKEKIFSFDEKKELISALKEKIEEGDVVLVDGSREMKMAEVVEAIKA